MKKTRLSLAMAIVAMVAFANYSANAEITTQDKVVAKCDGKKADCTKACDGKKADCKKACDGKKADCKNKK